jgi:uncharacterized protein YndB with AHSA1/START domain
MKILRYFSYAILALFIVFVLIGQLFGKVVYTSEVIVNQPITKTWNVFTDTSKMDKWVPGLISIELANGENGQVGARYKMLVLDGGTEYEMYEKVMESEPEKKYVFELENDVRINIVSYEFSEISPGVTKLTEKQQLHGKDFLMKPIFVFMKGYLHSQAMESLNKFKETAES